MDIGLFFQLPAAPPRLGPWDKGEAMPVANFEVDSYKFVPLNWRAGMESAPMKTDTTVWTGMTTPLSEATIALLTTAGLFLPASQASYDMDRERREPTWGDPTYRVIPRGARQAEMSLRAPAHQHPRPLPGLQHRAAARPVRGAGSGGPHWPAGRRPLQRDGLPVGRRRGLAAGDAAGDHAAAQAGPRRRAGARARLTGLLQQRVRAGTFRRRGPASPPSS